jgi:hypothetical protein
MLVLFCSSWGVGGWVLYIYLDGKPLANLLLYVHFYIIFKYYWTYTHLNLHEILTIGHYAINNQPIIFFQGYELFVDFCFQYPWFSESKYGYFRFEEQHYEKQMFIFECWFLIFEIHIQEQTNMFFMSNHRKLGWTNLNYFTVSVVHVQCKYVLDCVCQRYIRFTYLEPNKIRSMDFWKSSIILFPKVIH